MLKTVLKISNKIFPNKHEISLFLHHAAYPLELQKTLTNYDQLVESTKEFSKLEIKMSNYFLEKAHLKWREGNSKTSFVYLLLDPRITENLSINHTQLSKAQIWEKFLNSIFYIGKGKQSRPYTHLYDAIKAFNDDSNKQRIVD